MVKNDLKSKQALKCKVTQVKIINWPPACKLSIHQALVMEN